MKNKQKLIVMMLAVIMMTSACNKPDEIKKVQTNDVYHTVDTADSTETPDAIETPDVKVELKQEIESRTSKLESIIVKETSSKEVSSKEENTEEESEIETDIPHEPVLYDSYLWVGDSRVVEMAACTPITYIAQSGEGVDWLTSISPSVFKYRHCNILFSFGGNDLNRVLDYANFYNNMPQDFIDNNNIFIVSLNPVDEEMTPENGKYYLTNANFSWYNANLQANLSDQFYWINCYDYLMEDGYVTCDGLHYDIDTYIKIYDYCTNVVIHTF